MRNDARANDVIECTEGRFHGWRSTRPEAAGLTLTVTDTGKVKVTTGGPQAKRFLPAGHAPIELDMTAMLDGYWEDALRIAWGHPRMWFVYGDRDTPVPDDIARSAFEAAERFVRDVLDVEEFRVHYRNIHHRLHAKAEAQIRNGQADALEALAERVNGLADIVRAGNLIDANVKQDLLANLNQVL